MSCMCCCASPNQPIAADAETAIESTNSEQAPEAIAGVPTAHECKLPIEIRLPLALRRYARAYEACPSAGLSSGPMKLETADLSWADKGIFLFSFGAYASTHIVATGSLEDALEEAAQLLAEIAPGCFVDPEYPEGYDPQSDDYAAAQEAETDLTYTESGWLASYEWFVREITVEDLDTMRAEMNS